MIILALILLAIVTYFLVKSNSESNKNTNTILDENITETTTTNNYEQYDRPKSLIKPNNKFDVHQNIAFAKNTTIKENTTTNNYKKYYRPKRYVISKNELNFYTVLLEIAKELDLIVFSQVSLYNILEPRPGLDYRTKTTYFNKISSKSIDFVLVDKNNCRIKLCIELDDSTHKQAKRIKRDNFINKLFEELEINLMRYPVYNFYYKDTLKAKIQENIKEHYYEI